MVTLQEMIKNLEIVILKPNEIYEAENFNFEFSALTYYYFLGIKKINALNFNYIKIWIEYNSDNSNLKYGLHEKILYIETKFDFSGYLLLKKEEKMKFQNKLISEILMQAFIEYKLDENILFDISNELKKSNWKINVLYFKRKIKTLLFKLIIYMDIDAFTLSCIIENKLEKIELIIFKSIPSTVVFYFFKKIKIDDKEVLIGNELPLFKIDMEKKEVFLIEGNKHLIDERLIYNP